MNPRLPLLSLFLLTLAPLHSAHAQVAITEFLASNSRGLATADGQQEDWIEITNEGSEPVDLQGYYLTDDASFSPDDPSTFWQFPQISLEARERLIVFASGAESSPPNEWHANFKLSVEGERLALIAPDGVTTLTDLTPAFPPQRRDVSYGKVSDGSFNFMTVPTPGDANRNGVSGFVEEVRFSAKHGFYDAPVTVTLETDTEGAEIIYTLDGREPSRGTIFSGTIGQFYEGPFEISETTVVRAVAVTDGMQDSVIRTQSYLFLDDILTQPKDPEGFPSKWGSRTPDYEMDPEVIGPIYSREEVKDALRAVPTISLVTDNDNLFARDGIYTNSQAKDNVNGGAEDLWERPVSVEMLGFPHGQTVQVNAGIRMQGNASRSPNRVKHNMRLIFRSVYGPGKLRFRLFEDSEVETFNSINLRSSNGDSWIHPGVRLRAQYIRDQWHREVQKRMGQPFQSQIYAHVYINGLYWGMYHVFERFEASLLSEHYGGAEDDWDALQDTPAFQDIVVNGSDEAYRETHNLAKRDLTDPDNYANLLDYVDVDNQIDYLLINFYSGNQDWDHKNMRYARRRTPAEGNDIVGNGWAYFAWDSERAGLNGLNTQSLQLDNTNKTTTLGPTFLNAQMHDNPDYHLRFADRVVKHFFNGGELSPEGAARSWNYLADIVYEPLIGESARWGDLHVSRPETREGNWQKQLDKENTVWFPNRSEVVLDQFADRNFIPARLVFPEFAPFGGMVAKDSVVTMKKANTNIFNPGAGDIFYRMDGRDPRQADGTLHPEALLYDDEAPPTIPHTLTLQARIYDSTTDWWSPLGETTFHLAEFPTVETLALTEIHYAPSEPSGDEAAKGYEASDFEFIELQNLSSATMDLSGLQLTNGVNARVADADRVLLESKAYGVIVANREAFALRHPGAASKVIGTFSEDTRLDNQGERLTIRDRDGLLLLTVRYNDKAPWPEIGEGGGNSIAFTTTPEASIADPALWALGPSGGSPGSSDTDVPPTQPTLSEWLTERRVSDSTTLVGNPARPALLYYALGIDDFSQPTTLNLGTSDEITYQRRSGLSGFTWELEQSNDLVEWSAADHSPTITASGNGRETIRIKLNGNATYWRLRVTQE